MKRFNLDPTSLHSIIVIENDTFYERSDAALKIAQHLSFPWSVIGSFKVIPKVFRDKVYDLIAKNRYRLFGKQDYCMIPTRELKARFVE